jgi:hypothetical protein
MAVGDKWEVKFYAVAGDQVGINVRHYYTLVETGGGIGVQDMVDQISAQASFSYRAWLSNQARYVGATMQLLNVIPPPSSPTVTTVGAGDGVAIGGMLPRQVAGLIHYNHGDITVLDRKGLEAGACECYTIVSAAFDRFLRRLNRP